MSATAVKDAGRPDAAPQFLSRPAPGIIAAAVFSGRRYAEELEEPRDEDALPFRREVAALSPGPPPWRSA